MSRLYRIAMGVLAAVSLAGGAKAQDQILTQEVARFDAALVAGDCDAAAGMARGTIMRAGLDVLSMGRAAEQIGACYGDTGRFAEAEAHYDAAIEANHILPDRRFGRGVIRAHAAGGPPWPQGAWDDWADAHVLENNPDRASVDVRLLAASHEHEAALSLAAEELLAAKTDDPGEGWRAIVARAKASDFGRHAAIAALQREAEAVWADSSADNDYKPLTEYLSASYAVFNEAFAADDYCAPALLYGALYLAARDPDDPTAAGISDFYYSWMVPEDLQPSGGTSRRPVVFLSRFDAVCGALPDRPSP